MSPQPKPKPAPNPARVTISRTQQTHYPTCPNMGWVGHLFNPTIVVPTYMKLSVIEGLIGYMDHASARVQSQGARMICFSFARRLYNPSVLTVCGSYVTSLCCFLNKLNYAKYHARPFIEIYYNFILD